MHHDDIQERLYRAYQRERDNGLTQDQLHADGVYGDFIDDFADRYYAEQQAYERAMGYEDRPTLDEWYANQNPRR